jgi:hypothetical protein
MIRANRRRGISQGWTPQGLEKPDRYPDTMRPKSRHRPHSTSKIKSDQAADLAGSTRRLDHVAPKKIARGSADTHRNCNRTLSQIKTAPVAWLSPQRPAFA